MQSNFKNWPIIPNMTVNKQASLDVLAVVHLLLTFCSSWWSSISNTLLAFFLIRSGNSMERANFSNSASTMSLTHLHHIKSLYTPSGSDRKRSHTCVHPNLNSMYTSRFFCMISHTIIKATTIHYYFCSDMLCVTGFCKSQIVEITTHLQDCNNTFLTTKIIVKM